MKQTRKSVWFVRAWIAAAVVILLAACASPGRDVYRQAAGVRDDPRTIERLVGQAEDLTVVDCLLPGKMRKMGRTITWVTRPRPVKQTATDCEILGGQYILFDRANPATALAVWTSAAETGDPTAQTYVGEIYERGLGRARDYQTAARWYRKAADQGHARAQLRLGALYEKGLGLKRDPVQALDWYRKAVGLSKDKVIYLSQALAMVRASQPRQPRSRPTGRGKPRGTAHAKKARGQVRKIRSARKSKDRQVRTAKAQVAQTRQGVRKRLLDRQPSLALNAKRRLIDQTVAMETVATKRDGLQAIEKLSKVAGVQADAPSST